MKEIVAKILEKELKSLSKNEIINLLEVPPSEHLGDFSFPCFSLAKIEKKSPVLIAENLAERLRKNGLAKEISNVDAKTGYVNFFMNKNFLAQNILKKVGEGGFGKGKQKRKIIIDYSAPNVAKHFGIHNLRSTLIGHALYNILRFSGNNVIGINHLGDWGTQFGKLIVAYKKWGEKDKLKDVAYLNSLYVKFHEETEKDKLVEESMEKQAREEFKKLEDGDKENLALWKKFIDISLLEFERVYKILGIKFEETKGESFYIKKVDEVIKKLELKKLLEQSEGARVVLLKEKNTPPCIIEKSDEASTYASRDLAAILTRMSKNPDKILYVVDFRQSLHFEQIFSVAEKMGIDKETLVHIKFGVMKFKDMEMSTRKGKVILFEDLLEKAKQEILKIIKEKNPELKDKEKIAEKVALSAIIFADLQNNRIHDVTFDWKQALSFEGKTGPYILYTYARASSVLDKIKSKGKALKIIDLKPQEVVLLKELEKFPEKVEQSANQYLPHVLAEYAYELAKSFNDFYHNCTVLGSEQQEFRLELVRAFRKVMKDVLNLLGIEEVSEM